MDATITAARCHIVRVPLLQQWVNSPEFGVFPITDRLILRLEDSQGLVGWGESPVRMTDGGEELMRHLVGKKMSQFRLAMLDLSDPEGQYWRKPVPPSPYTPPLAKIQFRIRHPLQIVAEMALSDLLGKRAGLPLCQLWGGAWRDKIKQDYWMGRTTPADARRCVRRAKELGLHGIKLKTTLEDENVARLEAIAEEGGPDFHVTVDPNSRFYNMGDALDTILQMDALGNMTVLEDPFPRHFLHEYEALRPRIKARLVVHIDPPEALCEVLKSPGVGGLNLDSHTAGLWGWRCQAAAAEQMNMQLWHGSGLDLGVYTAAQLHLAACAPNCTLPGDQIGPWIREHHLLTSQFVIRDGALAVPMGPGLGVEIDEAALDRYTVGKREMRA